MPREREREREVEYSVQDVGWQRAGEEAKVKSESMVVVIVLVAIAVVVAWESSTLNSFATTQITMQKWTSGILPQVASSRHQPQYKSGPVACYLGF